MMTEPRKPLRIKMMPLNIRLPEKMIKALDDTAIKMECSRSDVIRAAVWKYLESFAKKNV